MEAIQAKTTESCECRNLDRVVLLLPQRDSGGAGLIGRRAWQGTDRSVPQVPLRRVRGRETRLF